MGTLSHSTLGRRFRTGCDRLGVPEGWFPYHTSPIHDATPHVEISGGQYHYVVVERGVENERNSTNDADGLIYWLIDDVVVDLAI